MFEGLTEKFNEIIKQARGLGKISEENISEMMRDIRISLLEADVNYKVVKEFTNIVKEKALGEEVKNSLRPGEVFVKIINDELVNLLGEDQALNLNASPASLMLIGLQGSGKTTTIGKLANYLRKKNSKKPLLVACDIYRPAAIDQLKQIGKELGIEVFEKGKINPVEIATEAVEYAKKNNFDYVLIDTAGRLHIDNILNEELINIKKAINPEEILLVIDAMMGQDAINVIQAFNDLLPLTGTILTKLDGDTRGGVALSLRYLTNIPIKFIGNSEKLDGIDAFDAKRMAGRILGMGDIVALVSKASEVVDLDESKNSIKRLKSGKFDLEDFLKQMKQIKKLGPLENIIKLIPGASKMGLSNTKIDPKQLAHTEAIILSMTKQERRNPDIIKASRKQRIAKGSGVSVMEVNKLLSQFINMKQMMKQFTNNNNMKLPF